VVDQDFPLLHYFVVIMGLVVEVSPFVVGFVYYTGFG